MTTPASMTAEEQARQLSRQRRQERKKAQQLAMKTGVWDRCMYRVPGRARFCAQQRSPESGEFCATHMKASSSDAKGKRVPCPVDPSHTIFEKLLKAHVKICNLTRQAANLERQPYYSKGINSGVTQKEGAGCCATSACGCRKTAGKDGDRAEDAMVQQIAPLDERFVLDVIARVSAAHASHVGDLRLEVLDPPEVQALQRARVEGGAGFRKGRHVLQQASIVGHMLNRGLVGPSAKMLHVEMGAGRGVLGQAIATAFPGSEVTMVERSSVRRKADHKMDGISTRARIDIRDLNMEGLPSLTTEGETRPVVAVAKHLCGVATDLALRAMTTLPSAISSTGQYDNGDRPSHKRANTELSNDEGGHMPSPADSTTDSAATLELRGLDAHDSVHGDVGRIGGIAIATCCHHACVWDDYTGKKFLLGLGFDERDFEAMRRVSAWINLEHLSARTTEEPDHLQAKTSAKGIGDDIAELSSDSPKPQRNLVEGQNDQRHQNDHCEDTHDSRIDHSARGMAVEEVPGAFSSLSGASKAAAARKCKRLLDRGRTFFVAERLGLRSEIIHFVDREVTPENALLLGFRDKQRV